MQVCLVPLLGPLVLGRNKKNASFLPFLVFHYYACILFEDIV